MFAIAVYFYVIFFTFTPDKPKIPRIKVTSRTFTPQGFRQVLCPTMGEGIWGLRTQIMHFQK